MRGGGEGEGGERTGGEKKMGLSVETVNQRDRKKALSRTLFSLARYIIQKKADTKQNLPSLS